MNIEQITICGGGNGAHVLTAIAAYKGIKVNIYTPYGEEAQILAEGVLENNGIEAVGNFGKIKGYPNKISANPEDVIPGSQLIVIVTPAFAHERIIKDILPYTEDNAYLGTMPARSGFEFSTLDIVEKEHRKINIFSFQTLPWACRIREYSKKVDIMGLKDSVGIATFPREKSIEAIQFFAELLDTHVFPIDNMLALSLANIGQIVHPGIMYGHFRNNPDRIFTEGEIPLFYQGIDEETAVILEKLSNEIQEIKRRIEALYNDSLTLKEVIPLQEWLINSYEDEIRDKSTLRHCFITNKSYDGLKVPVKKIEGNIYKPDYQNRYLIEDVPYGLVITKAIALMSSVDTPMIDEVVENTSRWSGKEYLVDGKLEGRDIESTRIPQKYGIYDLDSLIKKIVNPEA